MRVRVRIETAAAQHALLAARKEINRGVKDGLAAIVEEVALPRARATAPVKSGRYRSHIRAKSTTTRAFLEVRTKDVPYAGLLNFGGTRRDIIRPKNAKALRTPMGPRAAVKGPRRYKPSRHLEKVVEQTRAQVMEKAQEKVVAALSRHVEVR